MARKIKKQPIRKTQSSVTRRPLLIIGLILLMAVVALGVIKILSMIDAGKSDDILNNNQAEESEMISSTSQEDTGEIQESSENPKTPKQYESGNPNELNVLTGSISYSGVNNGILSISVIIDQFLGDGTCELTLSSSDGTVMRSTGIIASTSYSVCDGFDIPVSELSSGLWDININIISGDKTGIISGEVNI